MVTLGLAGVVFLVFLAGVAREPRAFGNAVLLGLALALGALGLAERLADTPGRVAHLLLLALVLAVALVPFVIGCYLLANGITMIRRESLRPGNLLSLLAGTAVFVVIGLDIVARRAEDVELSLFATVANLVFGYMSFLLVSYVCYAFVYGLLARACRSDFVIVLGAGLGPGGQVPPLLASRLDPGTRHLGVTEPAGHRAGAAADRLRRQRGRRTGGRGRRDGRLSDVARLSRRPPAA